PPSLLSVLPPPPCSPLFPYTTLFRSVVDDADFLVVLVVRAVATGDLLGQVVHVGEAVGVEMRPVGDHHDDVGPGLGLDGRRDPRDRKSTRLNSSHLGISYAVFCLKKK